MTRLHIRDEYYTLLDDEDVERVKKLDLRVQNDKVFVWQNNQRIALHRYILGLSVGQRVFVYHINNDMLDNRKENLGVVTPQERYHMLLKTFKGWDNKHQKFRPTEATLLDFKRQYGKLSDVVEE